MSETFGVKTQHPEYTKRERQWEVMRDVMEGDDAIKAAGEKYLPRAASAHTSWEPYELKQYEAFKARSIFTNYTAQIHDCLHGMIENRPAKIDVPQNMKGDKFLDNVDYQGNSADQFFSDSLDDSLVTGFGGILADLPNVDPNMSKAMAEKKNIHPYLSFYRAESIINWKYKVDDYGVKKLSLVVLKEMVEKGEDQFSHTKSEQYRVLSLEKGVYYIQIYSSAKGDDGIEKMSPGQKKPFLVNGQTIDYIPFIMLPFTEPVKPILYDIAKLNIHHYMVTADYQNGAHLTSRPTGYFTGHEPEKDPKTGEVLPVYVGTDEFWQIPEPDAKVGVCSFSGEGIEHLENALSRDESQIIMLASHIIAAEKKTAENKDAMMIRKTGEDAKLATYAKYLSYRFTQALQIVSDWLGNKDADVAVQLNNDFSSLTFDANAINSIANIFSQGKLPLRCLYNLLQQSGYLEADMSYEDFVYLLDLESAKLSPMEVEEAYKIYKKNGQKKDLPQKDWYSPDVYKDKETVNENKETVSVE